MMRRVLLLLLLAVGSGVTVINAAQLPGTALVQGVEGHAQAYPLSCESRSAADLAAYWGVHVGEAEFLASLPRSDNPDVGFVGSPHGAWGRVPPYDYGVHAEPVAHLLRAYGLDAAAYRGLGLDDLRAEAAAGRPAIVWLVGNVWAGAPQVYTAADGRQTTVAPFEHTFLFVGYTPTSVALINASNGQTEYYRTADFLTSWAVLGNMAALARGPANAAAPLPAVGGAAYTVQAGDRLASIAARHNTTWPLLAQLNQLTPPYTIYPGQTLRLPAEASDSGGAAVTSSAAAAVSAYTVQAGEYLAQICRRLGLDWPAVARLNGLTPPYTVYPGQVLQLPAGSNGDATPSVYLVQPGDTLAAVAARFGLHWPTLATLNGIAYPYKIYAYQELRLR